MSGDAGEGKDLHVAGLGEIAKGITLVLSELRDIGIDSVAGTGRGFSELALSGLELGHAELLSEFSSFCERWEWGVRALVAEGNEFAQNVGLSAGTLYETDQYVGGALKILGNAAIGNPHASEDEVTGMSWDEIRRSGTGADWSRDSFEEAWDNGKQNMKDAGRDVMTSPYAGPLWMNPQNLHGVFGVSDPEYDQMLDDTFGPSPEERQGQAEEETG